MSRKDYVRIAAVFATTRPASEPYIGQWTWTVRTMSASLAADNAQFDVNRFLTACGVA